MLAHSTTQEKCHKSASLRLDRSVHRSTALVLTAPSLAEVICASTLVRPNVLGAFLAPIMFLAFPTLIAGVAIASKHHESTPRSTWALLAIAGVAQIAIFISLGAFR
jgi:hypothetical protein